MASSGSQNPQGIQRSTNGARRGCAAKAGTMTETRFTPITESVRSLIDAGDYEGLRHLLEQYQPTEIAAEFENFSPDEQIAILRQLPTERAVDIFECLEEPLQMELLNRLRRERQAAFLREMEPDERADLFQALPDELARKFLALLPREEKEDVRELLGYGPATAGGLMTTEFAWVEPEMTVAEAIEKFRNEYAELEMVYYIYVLDKEQRLVGLFSLRQLLLHSPQEKIKDIMFRNVISVAPDTDQEEVARILTLYDFYAIPVVDERKRMLGIVTFDDIADVLSDEATEDLEKFGAVLPSERSYTRTPIWDHVRRRVPWLVILLALSSVSGFIIRHAQHRYLTGGQENFILFGMLVALYPMLTATAGNAGSQCAVTMIRGLATGEIKPEDQWEVIRRELIIGFGMGVILAGLGFARALIGSDRQHWLFLGCSVGAALVAMMIIANLMGVIFPLFFEKIGLDPALISGPLIATLMDMISATVYFSMAGVIVTFFFPLS